MTKAELLAEIASRAGLTKADAGKALDAFCEAIIAALCRGDDVALVGFGSFTVKTREARTGRNPATGAEIQIPASRTVGFKAGKALKGAVN